MVKKACKNQRGFRRNSYSRDAAVSLVDSAKRHGGLIGSESVEVDGIHISVHDRLLVVMR